VSIEEPIFVGVLGASAEVQILLDVVLAEVAVLGRSFLAARVTCLSSSKVLALVCSFSSTRRQQIQGRKSYPGDGLLVDLLRMDYTQGCS